MCDLELFSDTALNFYGLMLAPGLYLRPATDMSPLSPLLFVFKEFLLYYVAGLSGQLETSPSWSSDVVSRWLDCNDSNASRLGTCAKPGFSTPGDARQRVNERYSFMSVFCYSYIWVDVDYCLSMLRRSLDR